MPEPLAILSVSQLTRKIRMMLEIQVGEVWVEGEVSNLRRHQSGHVYFTLKDGTAQLSCVMFRSAAAKQALIPADGMLLQAFGELSVYEAQGKYQLVVTRIQEKGIGRLQAQFEALKARLQEEGLFAAERKRPIPRFPATIALVTSPTGAAVRDMLQVLRRRAPWVHVILAPTAVQGAPAKAEIAAAIALVNRESGRSLPVIDTLIVGRGGGSLEDLWSFNEEVVARAIAASAIPVISAVGHEIDFTIADFTADLRAPTPSAAAELAVPDGQALHRILQQLGGKLHRTTIRHLDILARVLATQSRESLRRGPEHALRRADQALDQCADRLRFAVHHQLLRIDQRSLRAKAGLAAARPDRVLAHATTRLATLRQRLHAATTHQLAAHTRHLAGLRALLTSLGPESILARGFSLTLNANGMPLRRAADARAGDRITTRLADGTISSVVAE